MSRYSVFLHRRALKSLEIMQELETKSKIKRTIESLAEYLLTLRQLDVKKLEGFDRAFRVRVGSYRIIFHVNKQERTIFVTNIEKRESVYE